MPHASSGDDPLNIPPTSLDRLVIHRDSVREVRFVRPKAAPEFEVYSFAFHGASRQASFRYRNSYTLAVAEGAGTELAYGGHAFETSYGTTAVSRPFESPRIVQLAARATRACVLAIAPALVEQAIADAGIAELVDAAPGYFIAATPRLSTAIRIVFTTLRRSTSPVALQAVFGACVDELVRLFEGPLPAAPAVPMHVRRAKEYLHAHFREDISLEALATATGDLHPRYLLALFHRTVNLPPHQYVLHIRVNRARELLASGSSVTHAARDVGFYDQSQLHRHFVRIVGLTPGEYARACRDA